MCALGKAPSTSRTHDRYHSLRTPCFPCPVFRFVASLSAGARPRTSAAAWRRPEAGRAQLLREERDAQLLDQPAELLELRVVAAGVAVGLRARLVLVPQALRPSAACFWSRSGAGAVLLEAQRVALEVARQVLEALPRRARKETGVDQPLALRPSRPARRGPSDAVLRDRLRSCWLASTIAAAMARRGLGHRRQPRLGALLLLLERLRRARRLVLADERAVEDRREEVGA